MKYANRTRIAMAASAALALTALSSSASAELDRRDECESLAWATCNPDFEPWNPSMFYCWNETYNACMAGGPSLAAKEPDKGDRRSEVRPA